MHVTCWNSSSRTASLAVHGNGLLLHGGACAMEVRTPGWLGIAPAGHVIWVPADAQPVRVRSQGPWRAVTLRDAGAPLPPRQPLVMDGQPLLQGLLRRLEQFPEGAGSPCAELVSLLLREMHDTRALATFVTFPADPRLASVCDRMEASLHLDHEAQACAKHSGLSPRTLQRLFAQQCGMATATWIRRRRLLEALWRMGQGDSVADVAQGLGYRSFSAFGAMVRKTMGAGPRQFQVRPAVRAQRATHASRT